VAVRAQGRVEIIRHGFARQVGDHPDAIERQAASLGARGHSSGLHFHHHGSAGAQKTLLFGCLRDMVDGANHAAVVTGGGRDGERRVAAIRPHYAGGHDYVSYAELGVEGAAEAGADHGVGEECVRNGVEGGSGAEGPGAVGNGEDVVAA
jgi:hypothetical protein